MKKYPPCAGFFICIDYKIYNEGSLWDPRSYAATASVLPLCPAITYTSSHSISPDTYSQFFYQQLHCEAYSPCNAYHPYSN